MIVNLVPYKRRPVVKTVDKYNTDWFDIDDNYFTIPNIRIRYTGNEEEASTITWSTVDNTEDNRDTF